MKNPKSKAQNPNKIENLKFQKAGSSAAALPWLRHRGLGCFITWSLTIFVFDLMRPPSDRLTRDVFSEILHLPLAVSPCYCQSIAGDLG